MMGRSRPVGGKEMRNWRSTGRPAYGKTRGLADKTGVGGLVGSFAASPIKAWSVGFRDMDPSLDLVVIVSSPPFPK